MSPIEHLKRLTWEGANIVGQAVYRRESSMRLRHEMTFDSATEYGSLLLDGLDMVRYRTRAKHFIYVRSRQRCELGGLLMLRRHQR